MSNATAPRTREERVGDALEELVDYALPPAEDNDPDLDARFNELFNLAQDTLDNSPEPSIAPDVHHVSELISKKLVRDHETPEHGLRYKNLFSRLLSQPVLSQKWAILYLLHQLSDTPPAASKSLTQRASLRADNGYTNTRRPTSSLASEVPHAPRIPTPRAQDEYRTSSVYNEAFSRQGLPALPGPDERPQRLSRPPPTSRRRNGVEQDTTSRQAPAPAPTGQGSLRDAPSEAALLRDLPFTLQGVSSTNLKFSSSSILRLPRSLPIPMISLLHTLAEPSLLYKSLSEFAESSSGGLIGQSLRSAIGIELRSYLGLVATLEGQIRRALAQIDETDPRKSLGKAGVTLRRCVLWTREATMGLRLMSLIVEGSKTRKGGQLISLIHSFSSLHGDPFVGAFAERLLTHVTRPFYNMLRLWIYDGELSDPYLEFFVTEHQIGGDDEDVRTGATSVWEDKYKIDDDMIPTIMTAEFAKKVFLIGKSLNFIRHVCGDAPWVESSSKSSSRELHYGDTAELSSSIDLAYKTTMARLIHLMLNKFSLLSHLSALKKYLLLSQGDFIALLMESLAPALDRPANSQYRHTLTAQLEHAIRNSNAQYDSPAVLRRLDARMLELSHGEIGWDVFTLEYRVDSPLDVIVTPHGSKQYLKVFNFLWRIKRVEYALGATWRRCMTGARGVLGEVDDLFGNDWKTARCVISEMIHFVNQLQYYILFEVIESSWDALHTAITKPDATLDDLIQAHSTYLRSITRKGLLGSSGNLEFAAQLHELLKVMLAYRDAVDGLYALSVAEHTARQSRAVGIDDRTKAGRWGVTSGREQDADYDIQDEDFDAGNSRTRPRNPRLNSRNTDSPLPALLNTPASAEQAHALRTRLSDLAGTFKARLSGLLADLAYQPDTDLRFLGVVMNFNEAYKVVRRGHGHGHGASGAAAGRSRGRGGESVNKGSVQAQAHGPMDGVRAGGGGAASSMRGSTTAAATKRASVTGPGKQRQDDRTTGTHER